MRTIAITILLGAMVVLTSCSKEDNSLSGMNSLNEGGSGNGTGGSTARFTISGNYLYVVDSYSLNIWNIQNPAAPYQTGSSYIGNQIETIYPYGNKLFIGSQNGMFLYDITNQANPQYISSYSHVTACDPVIADNNYAYITLRSVDNWCGQNVNELDIVQITSSSPSLVKAYPLTSPYGLAKTGNTLFVCDNGLKVFDATNVLGIILKHSFNIPATDIISYDSLVMVIGASGLYQYKYVNDTITLLSTIPVVL